MAKRKKKTDMEEANAIVMGFANLVDTLFVKYTGKSVSDHLKEFAQRPRELPPAGAKLAQEPDMPLASAYMVLGLAGDAPIEEVKRRYRNLARLYHPDMPGGYAEAFKLLDRAYKRVMKEKGK